MRKHLNPKLLIGSFKLHSDWTLYMLQFSFLKDVLYDHVGWCGGTLHGAAFGRTFLFSNQQYSGSITGITLKIQLRILEGL